MMVPVTFVTPEGRKVTVDAAEITAVEQCRGGLIKIYLQGYHRFLVKGEHDEVMEVVEDAAKERRGEAGEEDDREVGHE